MRRRITIIKILAVLGVVFCMYSYSPAVEYTLNDLYRIALERSEKVKISEEDVYIAERGKDKAMSALLPKVYGTGSYTRYTDTAVSSTGSLNQPNEGLSYGARLEQAMSMGGREITSYRISKDGVEKSKYDLYAIKEGYTINVATVYYDVLRAKKLAEISQAAVDRLTKHRNAAQTRLKVGEVTKTAVFRAEAELSGAQSDLIKSQNFLKYTKALLARIVGIEGEYGVKDEESEDSKLKFDWKNPASSIQYRESDFTLNRCQPLTAECLKEIADNERAELKSADLQKKIANSQITYAKGANWPTVSIEGTYVKKDESPPTMGLINENIYGGVRISFPFFEGGLRNAEIKEAMSKARQADFSQSDLKKSIGIEVDGAYLDYITQRGVLKSLEDQYVFANDNYNAVSKQFDFGLANSVDVMDANALLVTAERQLADSVYSYQLSILRVKRTTGTLLKTVINNDARGQGSKGQ
ncbi:MAG: TolC family protein [Proteobacteria bacterium]|nr:TolC family protein [Pseudomonadota bacterium]